ncbi:hypothetical protein [Microbacterium sp. 2FI]|uniref:hypothetical protein n=1 Tax=Microbacterium sp. 2FI TaxID=2502193 RepID=UPI0010F846DA|nr:hypothetical protein [Microbacterium sp. 2FI]
MRRLAPILLAGLFLTGCSAGTPTAPAETTPAETTPAEPERTTVEWDNYATEYQRIVDEETAEGDCAALQEMFDVAPDDPKLLSYIDEALTIAGCYDD